MLKSLCKLLHLYISFQFCSGVIISIISIFMNFWLFLALQRPNLWIIFFQILILFTISKKIIYVKWGFVEKLLNRQINCCQNHQNGFTSLTSKLICSLFCDSLRFRLCSFYIYTVYIKYMRRCLKISPSL